MNRDALMNGIHKTFFIMRLTIIIILIAVIQLSAKDSNGQKLTYNKNNATISEIFKEIKRQTGYNVIWYEGKLNSHMPIDVNFYNTPLEKVMDNVLDGRAVTYQIIGMAIVVKAGEPSFRDKVVSTIATIDVRGRVLDENNAPLVGTTVKIKGSTNSTVTNANGEFSLQNVNAKDILVISFIGYNSKEIRASENLGNIHLVLSTDKLQEVEINAGYYKVTDRERTGSISRITSKDIEKQPVNNILQAMVAIIPGVQITQTTGAPGGGFTVAIRGQNSINQGNDPFYIINGVPFNSVGLLSQGGAGITTNPSPLASINPIDIESIEVLKDADATAIYGSRGANGVILITTKRGKPEQNRAIFSINQGISRVGHMMNLMNTSQYLAMREEALKNDNQPVSTTAYDLNGNWDKNKDTDWQKELIGRAAPITNVQASLSGGTNNITYLMGGNYYSEETVFPGDNSYKRASGNFSLQYTSNNRKLLVSLDANYSQIKSKLFLTDITQFVLLPPNAPNLRDERGQLNWQNNTVYVNPIAYTKQPYDAKTNNLVANTSVSYMLLPELKLKANFGTAITTKNEFDRIPLTTYPPFLNLGSTSRVSHFGNSTSDNYSMDGQIEYIKKIYSGKLSALIGTTFQQGIRDLQTVVASGYNNDALMESITSASTYRTGATYTQYRYTAVFGRVNYSLMDRYFINATGRRDGSSRFGTGKQFANFGALGAAWIISEEKFMKGNLPFISFAKLRGSYGITGNDQIVDYGYIELWNTAATYQGITTTAPANIANPNYAWEVNKKAEIAIDLSFLKNRIYFSTGYYSNRSSNQLVQIALAPSTGFTALQDNLPATVANKGWEFELNTKNISSKSFLWSTAINLTIPKNELISYPGLAASGNANFYVVGQPLSIKKLFNTYVDDQTGLYARQDVDNNGVLDTKDQNRVAFVGRKFYGGIQNSFAYKGFSLDFIFQFVKQTGFGFYNNFLTPGSFSATNPTGNQLATLTGRWMAPGTTVEYQKYSTLSTASTTYFYANGVGNHAVYDASYVRLKNASISYNLLSKWIERFKIKNVKFYLQGENIFTLTKFKGLDPETQSLRNLPPLQVFSAGIQLTL